MLVYFCINVSLWLFIKRPPLLGEVSANFSGQRVSCGQRNDSPTVVNFGFLDRRRYFLEVAPQLSSRG
jgi:hypothetical protein